MDATNLATRVVDAMYNNDPFSKWLGIERVEDLPGKSILRMTVRAEMLNGFGLAHGGIAYCLADSALAFSSNAHGVQSLSVDTSIAHVAPVREGDVLMTEVEECHLGQRTAVYHIKVLNQLGKTVAVFHGTVFRTGKAWEV